MSFQPTGEDVCGIKPGCISRCLHRGNVFSVLEPDVGETTSWTAAAVTLQLCVGLRLIDSDHLHLQS